MYEDNEKIHVRERSGKKFPVLRFFGVEIFLETGRKKEEHEY